MGVPAFFRWLSRKYPSIVTNSVEDKPREINGVQVPVDCTAPNPNGVEFDNLYLDMNGIIHPCTHPEDKPAPKNEAEMMLAIFDAIDRQMRIVRPRKLLYMAVDGVAPRAKMNQQRSRRFRAAKEAREKREAIDNMRQELQAQGIPLPAPKAASEHFDSNCITPGTPFMWRLSESLRFYIHERLSSDPAWRTLTVILSDANVPGEGEHKIMDYIRRQRASPGHDPNTHHVLCGADADLIMLGLATHEPLFTIIREEFVPNQQRPCELCGQFGHELKQCQGLAKIQTGEYGEVADPFQREKNFIFIRLSVLREYLQRDLYMPNLPFKYDFERAIDDWVFMCFFVGNDFLPHLPSLEIREGAIDRLIKLYKNCVYKTKGYITENGLVNLGRVQLILHDLGEVEDEIFKERQKNELAQREKDRQRRKRMKAQSMPSFFPANNFSPVGINQWDRRESLNAADLRRSAYDARVNFTQSRNFSSTSNLANADSSQQLKSLISVPDLRAGMNDNRGQKRKRDFNDDDDEPQEPVDEVRLWEDGWKERYYQSKFEVSSEDTKFRYNVSHAYVEGLCWVLRYYYQGCCSWKWYFPYHYAPFASDFIGLASLPIKFDQNTKAIRPLEQLMSVFPAASRNHVPDPWAELMIEAQSPIIDFYPLDFKVDLNGKKFAWQGVALLPFVDAERLDETLSDVYKMLTDEEEARNTLGNDRLFVSIHHPFYPFIKELYDNATVEGKQWTAIDNRLTKGMSGLIAKDSTTTFPNEIVKSPLGKHCSDIMNNNAISVLFLDPEFDKSFIFPASRLEGAVDPSPSLKPGDYDDSKGNYRPQIGFTRDMPQASMSDPGKRFMRAALGPPSAAQPRYPQHQDNGFRSAYRPVVPHMGAGHYGMSPPYRVPPRSMFVAHRPMPADQYWRPPTMPIRPQGGGRMMPPRVPPPHPPQSHSYRPSASDYF